MVTANFCWSLPIEHLRDLVALCPAWQAWVRASGPDAVARAKARTYPVDLPPPEVGPDRAYTVDELTQLRPFAVVDTFNAGGMRLRKVAESAFMQSGSLQLCLEDNVSENDLADPAAAKLRFMNRVGELMQQLCDYAGIDGRLNVVGIDALTDAERTALEDVPTIGERFAVYLKLDYSA